MTATECVPDELVILVDEQDKAIGTAEKLKAHQNNWLHRAFSVFIVRRHPDFEVLLQQRAAHKYHSPELWTNTCCSHPRPEETVLAAANRRLQEEMGLSADLTDIGWFKYHALFQNGLHEHEIDHVLIGEWQDDYTIQPDPEEVQAYQWMSIATLEAALTQSPERFTPWLKQALEMVKSHLG